MNTAEIFVNNIDTNAILSEMARLKAQNRLIIHLLTKDKSDQEFDHFQDLEHFFYVQEALQFISSGKAQATPEQIDSLEEALRTLQSKVQV
ncbi:hypothetical protein BWI93_15150 [Siphonobacter sp. BAB-5385]|uniref:hypothetical protein n=1 Tax=unclassified Siphonobacter TaxID=2635712 RepID=UPI000B9E6A11|nr:MULTISPECIES: hypothetical protein [unclassified Siphonobacter]OZI07361.1 hypothetical protein BWI93_15150 [Siphonobacter sp. BAB-5385]PMD89373.1 hypothetical protein BWI97_24840 [Siphonobacter sp. BAB-5405]